MKKETTEDKAISGRRRSTALPLEANVKIAIAKPDTHPAHMQMLNRKLMEPSRRFPNPRKTFDEAKLQELAQSIEDHGVLQPLILRYVQQKYTLHEPDMIHDEWQLLDAAGNVAQTYAKDLQRQMIETLHGEDLAAGYEIVAGERRWRASGIAGLDLVPCIVRDLTDAQVIEIQHIENVQREDLTELEEAESYAKLIETGLYTPEALGEKLGKGRTYIYGKLRLAKLQGPGREALAQGKIDASVAELVAMVPGEKWQAKFLAEVLKGIVCYGKTEDGEYSGGTTEPLTYRQAKGILVEKFARQLKGAPFDGEDAELVPAAGACSSCPKRTGTCPESFPGFKNPNVCTDVKCFDGKADAAMERKLDAARKKGCQVLSAKESKDLWQYGYLKSGSGYEQANEVVHEDPQNRTLRQLLKGSEIKPVVAMQGDKTVELFPKKEAVAFLQETFKWAKKVPNVERKETLEEKAKREREVAEEWAVQDAWFEAVKTTPEKALWAKLFECLQADWSYRDFMEGWMIRRGCKPNPKEFGRLDAATQKALIVEFLVGTEPNYDDQEAPEPADGDAYTKALSAWDVDVKTAKAKGRAAWEAANPENETPAAAKAETKEGKPSQKATKGTKGKAPKKK